MARQESLRFRVSWIALLVTGLATLAFGVVVLLIRSSDEQYLRAIGAASIGMGLFGAMISVTAFRRRERWAFLSLCYYPILPRFRGRVFDSERERFGSRHEALR
jgi:hypothetical protein